MTKREGFLTVDELESAGITTVMVVTPDVAGRLAGRRVPVEIFLDIADHGLEICTCAWAWDVDQTFDLIDAGKLAVCSMDNGAPDVLLRPDLSTLRRAAWLDGVAVVFGDPEDPVTGEPLTLSPRVILKRQLAALKEKGLTPQVGTELEFYLFENNPRSLRKSGFREELEPTTLYASDFMLQEGNTYEPFFQKLRADLKASGILVEAAQNEWGTGQWEMTFVYGEALEMADRHALYKMAVRDSATRAGMSVTFMAKPLADQAGSSCHVHTSFLDDAGAPVLWSETGEHHFSDTMRHAVAGVLEHLPEFMLWYVPTINGYVRSNSQDVAGFGRTWGIANRSCSVRVVGHAPKSLRFEFRIPGADTNPYLTLSGIFASVVDGVTRELEPPAMSTGNAYNGDAGVQVATTLLEAARDFGASEFVTELLGEEDASHYRIMGEHEWNVAQTAVTDWQLRRYFDRI